MTDISELIGGLNAPNAAKRLSSLSEIKAASDAGRIEAPAKTPFVNNHIHTIYSFSPYSPTKALYMAWQAGLETAGIMDHDSLSGAAEFLEAGRILGMPVTVGMECRVDMSGTAAEGKRINNPDQKSVAYVALHGVPHQNIKLLNNYFGYYRDKRNERNRRMCRTIASIFEPFGITLDFDRDVLPISEYDGGGSVTERHLCYALAKNMAAVYDTPEALVGFLSETLSLPLSEKARKNLLAGRETPQYYLYDVLGILKSNFVERFYEDAGEECPKVREISEIANKCGAILCYAYLGDVGDSVTGDKKAQKFEDDYLDELFEELVALGFNAVTYMPSRNTRAQLDRVMALCDRHGLFQVSGEDINSPRQKFICEALADPAFDHLKDATYALIGHEKAATENLCDSMFSDFTKKKYPDVRERVKVYAKIGRQG
ncbi:MAG: PHP domain-containing protein [Clostridia bacterium]|nr:PHP domain-containing protein [Clostridia bacterium]